METIIIKFKDEAGHEYTIESDMPERFAKREAESYLYNNGIDFPVAEIISIS